MELTGRRGRRCKQVLDSFRKLKDEALNDTMWGTRFGRGYTSYYLIYKLMFDCLVFR